VKFFLKCLSFSVLSSVSILERLVGEETPKDSVVLINEKPKKNALVAKRGPATPAKLKVSLHWQVVSSLGRGTSMGTVADSYTAEGSIRETEPRQWRLFAMGREVPITFTVGSPHGDSVILVDSRDMRHLLGIASAEEDRFGSKIEDIESPDGALDVLRFVVTKNLPRQMQSIYRSSEEGLFMVKAAVTM
jgi:hypothetical protein